MIYFVNLLYFCGFRDCLDCFSEGGKENKLIKEVGFLYIVEIGLWYLVK